MGRTFSDMPATNDGHTWREFIALADDDRRELIDGRFLEIDVPTKLHEWIVATLVHHLHGWAMSRRAGIVLASGYKVRIRDDRAFIPDVQFFRRGGRVVPDEGLGAGAPDLAVEVISRTSARHDRVEKRHGYAEIGVPEYWIVDPEQQTVERFVLGDDGAYQMVAASSGDVTFEPSSFPGLVIDLAALWRLPEWFDA